MILRLAEHLDVPVRERNDLLVAAGYAPTFRETPLADPAMAAVRDGLTRLLAASEPNPTLVLHGTFDVAMTNRAADALLAGIPTELLRPPVNVMRVALHPQGLAPRIVNLAEWREHLLERMRRSMLTRDSPALRALYEEVVAYPRPHSAPKDDQHPNGPARAGGDLHRPPALALALPMHLLVGGQVLSLISTMTTFNTPLDVTVSELAVETFLPADPPTAQALADLAAVGGGGGRGIRTHEKV